MKEKEPVVLIEEFAEKINQMKLNETDFPITEFKELLWDFWNESEKYTRKMHLGQFTSTVNSHGFNKWYLGDFYKD